MRKTYTISEVIEREKIVERNQKSAERTKKNGPRPAPSKRQIIIRKAIVIGSSVFFTYLVLFIFVVSTGGINLGKGYKYEYFHDGYRITHNGSSTTPSDVVGFNISNNYIIGEITDPYSWTKQNNDTSYFVLNKQTNVRTMDMNKKDLEQLCEELNIEDCGIKRLGIYFFMVDPTYWYMRYKDE